MTLNRRITVLPLAVLLSCAHRGAQPDPCRAHTDPLWTTAIAAARDSAQALQIRERAPGLAVAAVKDGRIIWSEGFGYSDVAQARAVCPSTQFRSGSLAKVITVAALLKLYENNRIDLGADVRRYVPQFPAKTQSITVQQLASHTSGIRHYRNDGSDYINRRRYERLVDALAIFQADSLIATPGTRYLYSSYGYNLLGAALEGAAGQPYPELVRRLVLDPLNMRGTAIESLVADSARVTRFYARSDTSVAPATFMDTSDRWPSGGFLITANDAARLGYALIGGEFLSNGARALVLQEGKAGDKLTGYGLGLRIARDTEGRLIAHHGGLSIGGRAFLLTYPEHGLAIAVLANADVSFAQNQVAVLAKPFLVNGATR